MRLSLRSTILRLRDNSASMTDQMGSPSKAPTGTPTDKTTFLRKYLHILHDFRRPLLRTLLLFICVSLFDTLTIGLIGPFVAALLDPRSLERVPVLTDIFGAVGLLTVQSQLLALGVALGSLTVLKGVAAYAVQWRLMGLSFRFRAHLVKKLTHAYLGMPYEYYLRRNSSAFIQTITQHTKVLSDDLLIPSLRLVSDGTMVIMLGSFLVWVNWFAALTLAAALGLTLGSYIRFVRPRVTHAGQEVGIHHERVIRGVGEGIGGIKEIRVLRAEEPFFQSVASSADATAQASQRFNGLLVLPKYLMEAVIVLFVIVLSTFVILRGESGEALMATLAVFAAAGLRILPGITQVSSSLASMNYSRFALDELYEDLRQVEQFTGPTPPPPPTSNEVPGEPFRKLAVENIAFSYPGTSRAAIDGISIVLRRGESIGLIGKSGAGKTTLVDILLGLHSHDSGNILINDRTVEEFGWDRWVDQVAYIPQHVFLVDGSVEANVAFGIPSDRIDRDRVHEALRMAQLTELVGRLDRGLQTSLGERGIRLSGGERQRIGLARAFYMDRQVLILDEATSALDAETERHITDVIRSVRGERTIIVIAHRLTTVRECDAIYRLKDGRIVKSGTYEEVIGEQ